MVHTKTIFAVAIILIIQANGNEIVLHGQGKDGSYNEYRKSESSLPGGVSKTVVITRRMLGGPVNTVNLVSSSVGNVGKSVLNGFPFNLQPSAGSNSQFGLTSPSSLNSQWNLPSQNSGNQWNSVSPWSLNQQPVSASQWNLPSQPSANGVLGVNLQPNNVPWNLSPQMNLLGLNAQNNDLRPNLFPQQSVSGGLDSGIAPWNIQSGSSQWMPPPNTNNIINNPSSPSGFLKVWGSNPQQIDNSNYNPLTGIPSAPAQNPQNLLSQIGDNSNYNPVLGIPSSSGASSQQHLFSQLNGNPNVNLYPELNSNSPQGLNLNLLQNSLGASNQQGPWAVSSSVGVGAPNYYQSSPALNSGISQFLSQLSNNNAPADTSSTWGLNNQIPPQAIQQILGQLPNGIQSSIPSSQWGRSESSSSVEKRSADEVEEDNAEGHWLKK